MSKHYLIPATKQRTEITVVNSRFITTVGRVENTDEAKQFLGDVRVEMPDASHHVYAYRVGYGNSVIESMSDDGEPSGTAGPPVMAVLRGTEIGDVIVVVTRYFGGTKLGTGGLVRAYSEAARDALAQLPVEEKIEKRLLGIDTPYTYYEQIKRLIDQYHGVINEESFTSEVALIAEFPVDDIQPFSDALRELTAGQLEPIDLSD
ncbi:MAG: YigZ family protein [Anaerolineae bacterium]|nr:YigZ family protein [Anaerolineae bacterium]